MCGYIEYEETDTIRQSIAQLPKLLADLLPQSPKRYYPAFRAYKPIDIAIRKDGKYQSVEAQWWFDAEQTVTGLVPGQRTTFNARNLESSYWKGAVKHHRAVVFGTGLGESKKVGSTKHQYYMQSDRLFALAALYREFPNGQFSAAVITRNAHPKMEPYHDKAFPCFMPIDEAFLKLWLDPSVTEHPEIDHMLGHPTLYPSLKVQRVKTYKDKVPYRSFDEVTLLSDVTEE